MLPSNTPCPDIQVLCCSITNAEGINDQLQAYKSIENYGIEPFCEYIVNAYSSDGTLSEELLWLDIVERAFSIAKKHSFTLRRSLLYHLCLSLHRSHLSTASHKKICTIITNKCTNIDCTLLSDLIPIILFSRDANEKESIIPWKENVCESLTKLFGIILNRTSRAKVLKPTSNFFVRLTEQSENESDLDWIRTVELERECNGSQWRKLVLAFFWKIEWPLYLIPHILKGFHELDLFHDTNWERYRKIIQESLRYVEGAIRDAESHASMKSVAKLCFYLLLLCKQSRNRMYQLTLARALLHIVHVYSERESTDACVRKELTRDLTVIARKFEIVLGLAQSEILSAALLQEIDMLWSSGSFTRADYLQISAVLLIHKQNAYAKRAFRLLCDRVTITCAAASENNKRGTNFCRALLELASFAGSEDWNTIVNELIAFAFGLVKDKSSSQLSLNDHQLPQCFGMRLIKVCFQHSSETRRLDIIDRVYNNILICSSHATSSANGAQAHSQNSELELRFIRIFTNLAKRFPTQFSSGALALRLQTSLDYLTVLSVPCAHALLKAFASTFQRRENLRSYLILTLRKFVYKSDECSRLIAIYGLFELLYQTMDVFDQDSFSLTQLFSCNASKSLKSFSQLAAEHLNTTQTNQLEMDPNIVAEELFRQFCGIFRRALSLQTSVRCVLYQRLVVLFQSCAMLSPHILEMLVDHFCLFYEEEEAFIVPYKFDRCLVHDQEHGPNEGAYTEPLDHLLHAIANCQANARLQNVGSIYSNTELSTALGRADRLMESCLLRMQSVSLNDLGLDSDRYNVEQQLKAQLSISLLDFCIDQLIQKQIQRSALRDDCEESENPVVQWHNGELSILFKYIELTQRLQSVIAKRKGKRAERDKQVSVHEMRALVLPSFANSVYFIEWICQQSKDSLIVSPHQIALSYAIRKAESCLRIELTEKYSELKDSKSVVFCTDPAQMEIIQDPSAISNLFSSLLQLVFHCDPSADIFVLAVHVLSLVIKYWKRTIPHTFDVTLSIYKSLCVVMNEASNQIDEAFMLQYCFNMLSKRCEKLFASDHDSRARGMLQFLHCIVDGQTEMLVWLEKILQNGEYALSTEAVRTIVNALLNTSSSQCQLGRRLSMGLLVLCRRNDIECALQTLASDDPPLQALALPGRSPPHILCIAQSLLSFINSQLNELETTLKDLQAVSRNRQLLHKNNREYAVVRALQISASIPYPTQMTDAAPSTEPWHSFHLHFRNTLSMLLPFSMINFDQKSIFEDVIRKSRQSIRLTNAILQFQIRSKSDSLSQNLSNLFQIVGVELVPSLLQFVTCLQTNRARTRATQTIPLLIYEIERFDTAISKLWRLCKDVQLEKWCPPRLSRDWIMDTKHLQSSGGSGEKRMRLESSEDECETQIASDEELESTQKQELFND